MIHRHIRFLALLFGYGWSLSLAWAPTSTSIRPRQHAPSQTSTRSMTASALDTAQAAQDENKFEYVEYDYLTEADFVGSEWVVGTLYAGDSRIKETWVRLARTEDGKNKCFWGTKDEGTWNLDVASQFLSISRERIYGKEIWACTVDDYYHLQGTVRGWAFWKAASVYGQWQASRLGVDAEEAGPAPWFQEEQEDAAAAAAIDEAN